MSHYMDRTFSAAIEHIRVTESRITKQEGAIERLRILRRDSSDAEQRLMLHRAALEEMRIQLARLTPTAEQVEAPVWALPLFRRPPKRVLQQHKMNPAACLRGSVATQ